MHVAISEDFISCNLDTMQPDLDALAELAASAAGRSGGRMLEVGSWAGRTALALLAGAPDATLFCVDHWAGSPGDITGKLSRTWGPDVIYRSFVKNMGNLLCRRVFPLWGSSEFWSEHFGLSLDLVFIDGNHDYESVVADIAHWTPHVRPGGILVGHDFSPQFPGVERTVAASGSYSLVGQCLWFRQIGEQKR